MELLLFRRQLVPSLDVRVAVGKLRVSRNDAEFFLPFENLFTVRVPALVEFALVLIAPVSVYLVRSVRGAGRVVEEERLIRRRLLLAVDIKYRFVSDLVTQVPAIRTDMRLILHEVRLVLVGL